MFKGRSSFFLLTAVMAATGTARAQQFHLQEGTIDDIHRAIRNGQITCKGLVQLYLNRAKAYNGVADELVTKDGASIPPAPGVVRAGLPLKFPTQTIAISALLPDFDQYVGPPIEFGRMEPTASDPSVQQQYGMTVGIPNAGELNALGTLNLRGERSVTCKGGRDRTGRRHPARQPSAKSFASSPTRSSGRPNLTRSTEEILTLRNYLSIAPSSRSKIPTTRRTCAARVAPTRITTSISPPATTR
jgi:hypothetical protein